MVPKKHRSTQRIVSYLKHAFCKLLESLKWVQSKTYTAESELNLSSSTFEFILLNLEEKLEYTMPGFIFLSLFYFVAYIRLKEDVPDLVIGSGLPLNFN